MIAARLFVGGLVATVLPAAAPAATAAPSAVQLVSVAVLDRAVAKGNLLSSDDFSSDERHPAQARGAMAGSDVAGMEANRNLAAGSVVRRADIIAPRLVRRGEPVTILVRMGSLSITTQGRALASGGNADLVRVVSTSTNRTLDGIVDGPNTVRVTAP